jgi:hypothetical protein
VSVSSTASHRVQYDRGVDELETRGQLMTELPVTGAVAEYRGKRFHIVFSGDEWVALRTAAGPEVPDGDESGESSIGLGQRGPWVKVPRSALDGVLHVRATAALSGHRVSLQRSLPDGRILVEFVGPPVVAKELGLEGDQYMGWTGLVDPADLKDIHVEETRRASFDERIDGELE